MTIEEASPVAIAEAETDLLPVAEALLVRLGNAIPDPIDGMSHATFYACLIGIRARSLYANFLHSLESPAEIGPILALRPLVEAAIKAKWISLDPTLHGELWFAQAEDQDLKAMRAQETHLGLRVRAEIPPEVIVETMEQKAAWRDEAIARGREAGRKGDRPMPPLAQLVEEIENRDPGHRVAMRQAYEMAYRGFSPWEHTEATSFKATAITTESGVDFLGDRSPYSSEMLRLIGGAMFAYVVEMIGIASGHESAVIARLVRDYLTTMHPVAKHPERAGEGDSSSAE